MNGFRFRVWLEKTKRMVYPEEEGTSLVMKLDGSIWKFDYFPKKKQYDLFPLDEPYTILFSTMYQDREGKEIYEGDFVKEVISGDFYLIQFDPTKGFYGVFLPTFSVGEFIHSLAQRVVCVGNIKENFEYFLYLVKGEQKNGNE